MSTRLAERPLIDLRIEDLLREFNRARRAHDARRLIELRDELVHRSTPRALALAAHVAIEVEAAVLASPPEVPA
jgi:hypothetical protein